MAQYAHFQFLKDAEEDRLKRNIIETVLGWTTDIYPHFTDIQTARYTHKAMQYLNTMLWETFSDTDSQPPDPYPESPQIVVIDESWQRNICNFLGLTFDSVSKQPSNIVGRLLRDYEPYETDDIVSEGNCLFRCFSKIITGSQDSQLQLRTLISRFIASEGTSTLGCYFKSKQTTPTAYLLTENPVYFEGTWGSDVEIMAASAILHADIHLRGE